MSQHTHPSTGGSLAALLRAAHLGPGLVVTAVTAGLGVGVGLVPVRLAPLVLAAFAGQLSVGWSNDAIDGRLGRDAGRADKPVAGSEVPAARVWRAAVGALAVCIVASALLGALPGGLHLLAVAAAWIYNLGLKTTVLSPLPYAVAFGLLPVVVSTTAGAGAPRPWAIVAALCFGVGVHLSNALPDLARDRATGVRGLPQALGEQASLACAIALLAIGSVAALVGPSLGCGRTLPEVAAEDGPSATACGVPELAIAGLVVAGLLLLAAGLVGRRGRLEMAYRLTVLVGLLVVGALVAAGGRLV